MVEAATEPGGVRVPSSGMSARLATPGQHQTTLGVSLLGLLVTHLTMLVR